MTCFKKGLSIIGGVIIFVLLNSCNALKDPYNQSAMIVSSDETLQKSFVSYDIFFQDWSQDSCFNGYILDLVKGVPYEDMKGYADSRYKALCREHKQTNFKRYAVYILYCYDNDNFIVKISDNVRSRMNMVRPGDYYRLVSNKYKYKRISDFIVALNDLIKASNEDFEKLGRLKKEALCSPFLSTVNLKISKFFIPSDSALHRLFFYIPFGIAMVFVGITRSIYLSSFLLLILFFMTRMAFQRHNTRAKRFNMITACWWAFSAIYFIAFCCVVNSITPSEELRYGMISNNYSWVFEKVYAPYYSSYNTPSISIVAIVILVLCFICYWIKNVFLKMELQAKYGQEVDVSDDLGNMPGTIMALIGGACTAQGPLVWIVITYLVTNLIEYVYVALKDDKKHNISSRPFFYFSLFFVGLTFAFSLVNDECSLSDVIKKHCLLCWGWMALSSCYLLLSDYAYGLQNKKFIVLKEFDIQCDFKESIKNPIVNLIVSDYAVFVGITIPLFLIGYMIYCINPSFSTDSCLFLYVTVVGGLILAPCSVASFSMVVSLFSFKNINEFASEMEDLSIGSLGNDNWDGIICRILRLGGLLIFIVVPLYFIYLSKIS